MGQDESLPALDSSIVEICSPDVAIAPDEFDVQKKALKHYINPNHLIKTIIMGNVSIDAFPTDLQNITTLCMSNCHLSTKSEIIERTMFCFPQLTFLNLNGNQFDAIPSFVFALPKLQELLFSRNKLKSIASNLNVKRLEVMLNEIEEFPADLNESIIELNIGFNKFSEFKCKNPNLVKLNITGNNLTSISSECSFPNLEILDISYNKIVELPRISDVFPVLKIFKAQFNYLINLHASFPKTIETIDCGYNILSKCPEPLDNLLNLTIFYTSRNELTELPALPSNLTKLSCSCNKIKCYNKINGYIKHIDLSRNNLTAVPDVRKCDVHTISLKYNQINSVDPEKLPADLKNLDLSFNNIGATIDKRIVNSTKIHHLSLIHCGLTKLPPRMDKARITELNISENDISVIPPLPPKLKIFRASRCNIKLFPETLLILGHLEVVDLSCNQISKIASLPNTLLINLSVNSLTSLPNVPSIVKNIDVSHNRLTKFEITPNLEIIDISHNDISNLIQCKSQCLGTLKLAFDPRMDSVIEFENYPKLQFLDHAATNVLYPFPIPLTILEITSSSVDIANIVKNGKLNRVTTESGYSESIGARPTMEDALIIRGSKRSDRPSLYAVIDGHGGRNTANFTAGMLPKIIWRFGYKNPVDLTVSLDALQRFIGTKSVSDGATIGMVAIIGRDVGICHLGDTRIVLVKRNSEIVQLTNDHKATEISEIELIKANGGSFTDGRLSNNLAITRSIADNYCHAINHTADVNHYTIGDDDFRIVIGCDGIFDVVNNEDIGKIATAYPDVHLAAAVIKNMAMNRDTGDNMSVIVINVDLSDDMSIPYQCK